MLTRHIEEIYNLIKKRNSTNSVNAIPHSDELTKELQASHGLEAHDIRRIITVLKEAHKIFSIEVVKEDKDKDIRRVEGYVITDHQTIKRLKTYFQAVLTEEYERQFYRKLMFQNIMKEVYSKPGHFKNTPIGQVANKAMMLDEYDKLLEKHYWEYNDEWIDKKYNEILQIIKEEEKKKEEPEKEKKEEETGKEKKQTQRAVDSEKYKSFKNDSSQHSLNKILKIYGVDFFFRVNLRKYNFELLTDIIRKKQIDRKSDLKKLKDMLQKVKQNFDRDTKLGEYRDQIYELDRVLTSRIMSSR